MVAPERIGQGIRLAYCWAHARRKLIEITRSDPTPIAEEGIRLIRELYRIEADIPGPGCEGPSGRAAGTICTVVARINAWL